MKKIFVCTDFSKHADNAILYAIQLANQAKSQLVVFHSFNIIQAASAKDHKNIVSKEEAIKQVTTEYVVTELCRKHQLVKPEIVIYDSKCGDSNVDNILFSAKKNKADLIVVGTHGITGLKKVLFGRTTTGLIAKSKIPVLAIPQGFDFQNIEKIVCSTDLKNLVKEIKELAIIAEPLQAAIEILFFDYWNQAEEKQLYFDKLNSKNKFSNVSLVIKKATIEKTLAEHIKNYLRKKDTAILVMFPEDKNFFEKIFLPSITEKVVININKPLLSIRKKRVLK
jgi:nucleotide-binding universal stress UspA family protein